MPPSSRITECGTGSREIDVPGWCLEDDGDAIHIGSDLKVLNEAFKTLREEYPRASLVREHAPRLQDQSEADCCGDRSDFPAGFGPPLTCERHTIPNLDEPSMALSPRAIVRSAAADKHKERDTCPVFSTDPAAPIGGRCRALIRMPVCATSSTAPFSRWSSPAFSRDCSAGKPLPPREPNKPRKPGRRQAKVHA